jgi:pimeloyl-ACP methyl ester carboxylesterase
MALVHWSAVGRIVGAVFPQLAARIARRLSTHPRRAAPRGVPPGAEAITFRFGLAGLRWGTGGPQILALHGWEGRATQFRGLGERLAARGYRLIALDAPAHGRSPGDVANPLIFVDALQEVAAELGPLHAVVGHSMGGAAALLAQTRGMRAARSVVISAPAALTDMLRRMARYLGLPERATRAFIAEMERFAGEPAAMIDVDRFPQFRLRPLLVVHDRHDAVVPFADGERIAAVGHGELVETHGIGHRDMLRDAGVLDRVALFLAPRMSGESLRIA